MTTTVWTQDVATTVWVAEADPAVTWVVKTIIGTASAGGDGNVIGPTPPVVAGRPAGFTDTTGRRIGPLAVNAPNGLLQLDADGTAPDNRIPASIARDTEVTNRITAHTDAVDPHGDRAYTDAELGDLADAFDAALTGKVGTDDPRLSDARTPTAHTHDIADINAEDIAGVVDRVVTVTPDGTLDSAAMPGGTSLATVTLSAIATAVLLQEPSAGAWAGYKRFDLRVRSKRVGSGVGVPLTVKLNGQSAGHSQTALTSANAATTTATVANAASFATLSWESIVEINLAMAIDLLNLSGGASANWTATGVNWAGNETVRVHRGSGYHPSVSALSSIEIGINNTLNFGVGAIFELRGYTS